MPRVTHVKSAQQRYETKPVIDPETGQQKKTPVMSKGVQKTDKRGNLVFMKVTEADKSRPKPPLRCDYSECQITDRQILPGQAYKHITPKSGPYGGTQKSRHAEHPTWNVWEYSSSLSARVAEIESHFEPGEYDSVEDVQGHLEDIASEIDELASEKNEAADSIEDGFGHETYVSTEIREQAEALENWAEEVRSLDIPEFPEGKRFFVRGPDAQSLNEDGYEDESEADSALSEYLIENPDEDSDEWEVVEEDADEPTEAQMEEWRDEVGQMELGDPGV
jgi:hypothetical protein